jgi:hypothetical protein
VILEAATENPDPGGIEGRGDGIPQPGLHRLAIEMEKYLGRRVGQVGCQARWMTWKPVRIHGFYDPQI